ncbi:DUF2380 domain-containing protein [Oryzibacter oryziterrae]|uniref:DUF2380 domain-containing protein n=1 Tax=Oryzibacter oryziterrae TaxID=2766474 RepID=UPI001F1E1169|nr:DUF2380 domain-containing protein [Oryzibacter oryziterrae]
MRPFLRASAFALSCLIASALPAAAKPLMAIAEITYADTSGEPASTAGGHGPRLKALATQVSGALSKSGLYDTKVVARANCEDWSAKCYGKWVKQTGGNLIMVATVLKTSTLISHMWVGIFKSDGTTRIFYRDLQFRGDTADAWQHAGDYLADEILKAKPGL